MYLKDLVHKIDIKAVIAQEVSDITDVIHEFGIFEIDYDKLDKQRKLFSGYVQASYSTDTWVGLQVYVFESEVVAFSTQIGRKYNLEFQWVSKEAYRKVRDFCYSFKEEEEDNINIIPDEELFSENGYTLHFCGEMTMIHKKAKIGDETVQVLRDADPKNYISKTVTVQYSDGRVVDEQIENLLLPNLLILENEG